MIPLFPLKEYTCLFPAICPHFALCSTLPCAERLSPPLAVPDTFWNIQPPPWVSAITKLCDKVSQTFIALLKKPNWGLIWGRRPSGVITGGSREQELTEMSVCCKHRPSHHSWKSEWWEQAAFGAERLREMMHASRSWERRWSFFPAVTMVHSVNMQLLLTWINTIL